MCHFESKRVFPLVIEIELKSMTVFFSNKHTTTSTYTKLFCKFFQWRCAEVVKKNSYFLRLFTIILFFILAIVRNFAQNWTHFWQKIMSIYNWKRTRIHCKSCDLERIRCISFLYHWEYFFRMQPRKIDGMYSNI